MSSESTPSSETKRAQLAELLRQKLHQQEQPFPLSHGQRAMWFMSQVATEQWNSHVLFSARVRSVVDVEALQQVLQDVVRRHETLRTVFRHREGQLQQRIIADQPLSFEHVDVKNDTEQEIRQRAIDIHRRPFDLLHGPVYRVALLTKDDRDHVLLLAVHHIAFDGWSLWLVLKEIAERYRTLVAGGSFDRTASQHSYREFVQWQQEMLDRDGDQHIGYWHMRLAGELPVLELPTDRPRPTVQRFRGASHSFEIDTTLSRCVDRVCTQLGCTKNMFLLAVFQTFLAKRTGQDDIVCGMPMAARTKPEFEQVVGYFVNAVPIRTRFNDDPSFKDIVNSVRKGMLEAYEHQDYPLPLIVDRLNPHRMANRAPLFQARFVMQKSHHIELEGAEAFIVGRSGARLDLGGLQLEPYPLPQQEGQYDLTLQVQAADTLRMTMDYSTDLFDAATIERMCGHYEEILRSVLADSSLRLSEISLLTADERKLQLEVWNDTQTECDTSMGVHQLVEQVAQAEPDSVAAVRGVSALSYAELNQRANVLAAELQRRGVSSEMPVGICIDRSFELLIAELAILKAGGAYVPLDPRYPAQRLQYMVTDSGAALVITTSDYDQSFEAALNIDAFDFSTPAEAVSVNPQPEHLAYVIYTSGSTGKPKGVAIEHRALMNLVRWHQSRYQLTAGDRATLLAGVGFDASVWETWPYLTCGASLHIPEEEVRAVPSLLVEWLRDSQISLTFLPTPLCESVLNAGVSLDDLQLRSMLTGGDKLSRYPQEPLPFELVNHYGPTENAVVATAATVESGKPGAPPIGRPIANVEVYVLDEHHRLVPCGIPGELYIGGKSLARGYYNQPELTSERFISHPFKSGERLYRTGDLVRFRADGGLLFLGRNDDQVKIRGYRIELGEIESQLLRHHGVREGVIVAREAATGTRLIGYVTLSEEVSSEDIREHLKSNLPDYMVPAVVVLDEFPLTANGKIDRRALPDASNATASAEQLAPRTQIEQQLADIWCDVLNLKQVGVNDNFFEIGGHSLLIEQVRSKVSTELGHAFSVVDMFQYPTISLLASRLQELECDHQRSSKLLERRRRRTAATDHDIAVIGVDGRFPGAPSVQALWSNLLDGNSGIRFFSPEDLSRHGVDHTRTGYVPAAAALDDIDLFDAEFFGYTPREAQLLDPQQRVFLECAYSALEHAGIDPQRYDGLVGVYAGASANTYALQASSLRQDFSDYFQQLISQDKDFLTTRVAYKLDLNGPCMTIQTACSTSLVAIHQACLALRQYECDAALAGGVSIRLGFEHGYQPQRGSILSPDGLCRAFDAGAAGTIAGQGAGVVVLKRLKDAQQAHDNIIAVIKGSAVNNDGAIKVGFTAPGVDGQANVIAQAQADAEISPEQIGYIEAHGTGTEVGDPIEITALSRVFQSKTLKKQYCAIGSLKTNIGHLDAAAGVAGLIKVALTLQQGVIPPSLNYEKPNPEIDFERSPFYVNTQRRIWDRPGVRHAGVSSFGIGGTNAHVILAQPPESQVPRQQRRVQVLPLSARTPDALANMRERLRQHVGQHSEQSIADIAHTLQIGRTQFENREALLATADEPTNTVFDDERRIITGHAKSNRDVVFMFPGQGSQHPGMAKSLYSAEPVFKDAVDRCADLLKANIGFALHDVLFGEHTDDQQLHQTAVTQPALFVVEYALAQLWQHWGVHPAAMIGHSIGEFVAAHIAGVFSLADALHLVAVRGKLMQKAPAGAMLSVAMSADQLRPQLSAGVNIAVSNAPSAQVLSGSITEISELKKRLEQQGVACRLLHTSHAFHSSTMAKAAQAFLAEVSSVKLHPPQVPYISNLSGTWITEREARNPEYWSLHLRHEVRFSRGISELLSVPRVMLEVGPGTVLTALTRQHVHGEHEHLFVSSLPHATAGDDCEYSLHQTLAKLWVHGVKIDFEHYQQGFERQRVPLPSYPFHRKRYWIESSAISTHTAGERRPVSEWLYAPAWKQSTDQLFIPEGPQTYCLFEDKEGIARSFGEYLTRLGHKTVYVSQADASGNKTDCLALDAFDKQRFDELLDELKARDVSVDVFIYCVSESTQKLSSETENALQLVQSIGIRQVGSTVAFITNRALRVLGNETVSPHHAAVSGLCRVVAQEYPHLAPRLIDIQWPSEAPSQQWRVVHSELHNDRADQADEVVCASRFGRAWRQTVERLDPSTSQVKLFRSNGCYLIVGGLGRIGMLHAEYLARNYQARVALLVRAPFPERERWNDVGDLDPWQQQTIKRIKSMEQSGAEVLIVRADISVEADFATAVKSVTARFGAVDGVIHAAGVTSGSSLSSLSELSAEDLRIQLAAKLSGLIHLQRIVHSSEIPLCILTSSLSSILGGLGLGAYSAANAALDAGVHGSGSGTRWLSVGWDAWNFDNANQDRAPIDDTVKNAIHAHEADAVLQQLERIQSLDHVYVSTFDLSERVQRAQRTSENAPSTLEARPQVSTEFVQPVSSTEQMLGELWGGVLGFEGIGTDDNFFELGGDSLQAIQLMHRISAACGLDLSVQLLFDEPTISLLAKRIEHLQQQQQQSQQTITDVLDIVDQLSEEEVEKLLSQPQG